MFLQAFLMLKSLLNFRGWVVNGVAPTDCVRLVCRQVVRPCQNEAGRNAQRESLFTRGLCAVYWQAKKASVWYELTYLLDSKALQNVFLIIFADVTAPGVENEIPIDPYYMHAVV